MRTLLLLFLSTGCLMAAPYYVSFEHGNDANNGTTKATAWKRVKGMANASGTANATTPAAGEHIFFRGGETWTNSYPFVFPASGSIAAKIHYEVDQTWTTNGGTNAIFDFQNIELGGYSTGAGFQITQKSNIALVNFTLQNYRGEINNTNAPGNNGGNASLFIGSGGPVYMTNCIIKNWDLPRNPAGSINGVGTPIEEDGSGGLYGNGNLDLVYLDNCEFTQQGVVMRCGFAIAECGTWMTNCYLHHLAGGANGGGLAMRCVFNDIVLATDPQKHTDAYIAQYSGAYLEGCLVYNVSSGVCFWFGGNGGVASSTVVNCIFSNITPAAIQFSTYAGAAQGGVVINNVFATGSSVDVSSHGGVLDSLRMQNNMFLSASPLSGAGLVTTIVASHNLTNTIAVAASDWGATAGNKFKPTLPAAAPINTGTNAAAYMLFGSKDFEQVFRPQQVIFDIGAHESVTITQMVMHVSRTGHVGQLNFYRQAP